MNCSAWPKSKLNIKIGLHTTTNHHHHPPTTNFSHRRVCPRVLKFCTGFKLTKKKNPPPPTHHHNLFTKKGFSSEYEILHKVDFLGFKRNKMKLN
jgi:hypothetical protein